jgi:hypothetical protein
LIEDHCRFWPSEVNESIQRRNLELIRLVACMFKNNVFNSGLTLTLHNLLDPESFFFVKNKHGTPPTYAASVDGGADGGGGDVDEGGGGNNNNRSSSDLSFTIHSSTFPYTVELLEEFGSNGGFAQINKYFSLLSNINEVAKFLQIFSNSIHFLTPKCVEYFTPLKDKLLESLASIS